MTLTPEQVAAVNGRWGASALALAWGDEFAAEPYQSLPPAEQVVRRAAWLELVAGELDAVRSVDVSNLDELRMLLDWVDDPVIWPASLPRA